MSAGNGDDILVDGAGNDILFGGDGSASGPAGSGRVGIPGEELAERAADPVGEPDSGSTLDLTDVVDFLAGPAADASGVLHLVGNGEANPQVDVQTIDGIAIAIIDTTATLAIDENGNLTVLG